MVLHPYFKNNISLGVLHGDYNEQNILVLPSQVDKDDYDISGNW